MIESGYYPPGAEFDPNAPYNQVEPKENAFKCEVVETIRRDVDVFTSNYSEYYERDEDGFGFHEIDTDNVDWKEEYQEQYFDLPTLLEKAAYYLRSYIDGSSFDNVKRREIENIISQCEGWQLVEQDVGEK